MQINELASFILFCQELCKFWLADDAIELLLPPGTTLEGGLKGL